MRKFWWWGVPAMLVAIVVAFLYADESLGDHSDLQPAPRPERGWTPEQLALRVNYEASVPPGDLVEHAFTRVAAARAWVAQHDAKRVGIVQELLTTPEAPWFPVEEALPIRYHYSLLKLQFLHVITLEAGKARWAELHSLCECARNITVVPIAVRYLYRRSLNESIRSLLAHDARSATQVADVLRLIELCETTAFDPAGVEEAIRNSFAWGGSDVYKDDPHTFWFKPNATINAEARIHRAAIAAIRSGSDTIEMPARRSWVTNSKGSAWAAFRGGDARGMVSQARKDRSSYLATRAALAVRHFELANRRLPPDVVTAWPEAKPEQLRRITYDPVQRRADAGEAFAEF